MLWFIYLLAAFSLVDQAPLRAAGAALGRVRHRRRCSRCRPVPTGSYLVDQFAEYFVYFYAGYMFAPWIFRLVDLALEPYRGGARRPGALRRSSTLPLVFSPGYAVLPEHIQMGYAALPGLHLILALIGSLALCVTAALLSRLPFMGWLRWLGENSIVVYLVFVLPMSFARIALGKLGFIDGRDACEPHRDGHGHPRVYRALSRWSQWTGRGKFLFERPAWAHLPGTKGSRSYQPAPAPAE